MLTMATIAVSAFAQGDGQQRIRVVVDGQRVRFRDTKPVKQNDRVLVPLRGIFEALGARVTWDPATQTVSAHRPGTDMRLTIGQNDAAVNGQDVHLDVPAQLIGGSTMVPLRFVSESFGAQVTWNDQAQEADITSGPGRVTTPPPTESRPLRPIMRMDVIPPDSVLPLSLQTRLSSANARKGDEFTATLNTEGRGRYMGLPQGTTVYGYVEYARARRGDDAGVIELKFDHLTTPSGHSYPVSGRLIALEGKDIVRRNGTIVARGSQNDHMVFTGYGAGAGLILGLQAHRPIEDAILGGLLGAAIDASRRRGAHNVELNPGTQFGLRLYQPLSFPRGVQ